MEHIVRAYAKINITLDVVGKMPGGYHEMKMVMESISLCDDIVIKVSDGQGIHIQTNLPYLPRDGRNIAVKAAGLFLQRLELTRKRVDLNILKRIPVSAGLAGGSSNGAAVLRGLNEMLGTGLSASDLEKMGEELGSDVPYCIAGGTALAGGRGEKLSNLSPMPRCTIVICKPDFSVSTPELFAKLDCDKIRHRPDTDGVIAALEEGNLTGVARRLYNIFEDVPHSGRKEIAGIKVVMLDCGAMGAAMSGTGPTVYGIFDDEKKAERAVRTLKKSYRDTFLAQNIGRINV